MGALGCLLLPPRGAAKGAMVGDAKHGEKVCAGADTAKRGSQQGQPEVQ